MNWSQILGGLFQPISDAYKANQERKQAKETLQGKVLLAKEGNKSQLDLTDSEWEVVKASTEGGTWKDEYVTILITFPYLLIILGAVWSVCFLDPNLMNSGILAIKTMKDVGINIGFLMEAVVLGALSLKLWRK